MNKYLQPGDSRKFNCGDIVARDDDERHHGVVVAVIGNEARVAWPMIRGPKGETRFAKEDVDQDSLVLIERAAHAKNRRSGNDPDLRPKTLGESPRAALERWENKRREK